MKLIYAIVSSDDADAVSSALTGAGYSSTKLASTGGFLMTGNATLLIATEDQLVDRAIEIIKGKSKKRTQMIPAASSYGMELSSPFPVEITVGGATIFVTNLERFEKV